MKKKNLLFSAFILFQYTFFAQAVSYQAVARNSAGQPIPNQNISVKFDLHQGGTNGTIAFTETQITSTNQFGLFTLAIGSNSTTQFQAINWAAGPYFLEVWIDPNGGSSYSSVGTQQLLSVPYALYAKTSGLTLNAGTGISINSNTITNTAPNQTVTLTGPGVTGAYPNYTVNASSLPATTLVQGTNITLANAGSTYTVNAPTYSLTQSGANINLLQNGSAIATVTSASGTSLTAGNANINLIQSGNAYTITPVTPVILGTGVTNVSGVYPNYIINTPSPSISYTSATNQISITQGSAVSTISLTGTGSINGAGTPSVIPMWVTTNSLTNSPISTFTTTGGVIINPASAGSGSPAQSLQVHGPTSGSTYAAHFLNQHTANTGIGISTQPAGGHAIGTLDNQDLGFFTNNTNVTGGYPLVLKTNGQVGIGTTGPVAALDVTGNIRASGSKLFLGNVGGINSGYSGIYETSGDIQIAVFKSGAGSTAFGSANSLDAMIIKNTTGNVGIGTVSPSYSLDVQGSINASAFYNTNGLLLPPTTSNSNEGRIYFDRALGQKVFKVSENGGPWVPLVNNLWTKGTNIVYSTVLTDNIGIGNNSPSAKLDVLANSAFPAVQGTNNGNGSGVTGASSSPSSAALFGYNDGSGPSIAGSKSVTAPGGNAGRFETFNASNPADALYVNTAGTGASVHAANTSTVAASNNLAILVDGAHIKATAVNNITNTDVSIGANTLGGSSISMSSAADQSNDVRGAVTLSGGYGINSGTSQSIILTVSFKKPYKHPPIVVLTPYVPPSIPDNVIVTTQVLNAGNTDFTFKLVLNYVGTGATVNFSQITVNYFILE